MFVLTVEARTSRPAALRRHVLTWPSVVGRDAMGWLGNTAGVSADGELVLLLRFASQEAAWATSDLPGSAQWWQDCRRLLDTPPQITESTAVTGILQGGSDDAAAVRITRGSGSRTRLRDSVRQLESLPAAERAPVVGGFVAWHDGGRFTEALYLASPAGELDQRAASSALRQILDAQDAAMREGRVVELVEPWLASPERADRRDAR